MPVRAIDIMCVFRPLSEISEIFPHSDCTRRDTEYLPVFSPNTGKYGPEKLQIRTPFMQ